MPTINAGTSPVLMLPAGQRLAFAAGGAGLAVVQRVGSNPVPMMLGATPVTIGPYRFDHPVSINCERALSYEVQVAPFSSYDASGRSAVYQDPTGALSGPTLLPSGSSVTALQSAAQLRAATLYNGTYSSDETLLVGSDTVVNMQAGTLLFSTGTRQHTSVRVGGNAEFAAAEGNIPGVSIYCADQAAASGTGTLRYTHAGTTLAWQAPGDTAFGAEVSIAAVVSVATSAKFILASANGSQMLVYVTTAAARNANTSRTVRVEPVTGAKTVTWTRASNVRTVLEAAHGRKVGDFVINFGPAADVSHGYVTAVTAGSYTFPDTGADQAVAQTGRAFGVRNTHLRGNGACIDSNKAGLATALMSHLHAVIFLAHSDCSVSDLFVNNTTKYGIFASGGKNFRFSGIRSYRDSSSPASGNSDTVHITGPMMGVLGRDISAQGGDNIIGIGCCDYNDYNWHLPAYGTVDVVLDEIGPVRGDDTNQQPVRLYNANSGTITGGRIGPITGTYSTSADAAVAVISDADSRQVDAGATNVNGLVVVSADAVRSDGSVSSAFISRGAGTRRGLRIERLRPRSFNTPTSASVHIEDSTWQGMTVEAYGAGNFAGAVLGLFGTGTVVDCAVDAQQLSWDNALGGGQRGAIVLLNNANAVMTNLRIRATGDDVSASGNKANACWVNNGTLTRYVGTGHLGAGTDTWLRMTAGGFSEAALDNVEHQGPFVAALSVLNNGSLSLNNVFHNNSNGSSGTLQVDAASGTLRLRMRQVRSIAPRVLRNVSGNSVYLVSAQETEFTGTTYQVDAGTPALRLQGPTDLQLDGSAAGFDATVANHAAGATFYNTGAGFGAGVGEYARGSVAWVRFAA